MKSVLPFLLHKLEMLQSDLSSSLLRSDMTLRILNAFTKIFEHERSSVDVEVVLRSCPSSPLLLIGQNLEKPMTDAHLLKRAIFVR